MKLRGSVIILMLLVGGLIWSCVRLSRARSPGGVWSQPRAARGSGGGGSGTAGEIERQLTVGGLTRTYFLDVPPNLDRSRPAPLILAFHGGGGPVKSFAETTQLADRGTRAGFVVAFPVGVEKTWNAGDCCGVAFERRIDDISFVRAMIDDIATVIAIDRARVYATGFSNGGKLSYRLACELSDRIAAIAPSGTSMPATDCKPVRPVPIIHFHGGADRFAPMAGGQGALASTGEHVSVPDAIKGWEARNACPVAQPRTTYNQGTATCSTVAGCGQGAEVTFCVASDAGHQWLGGRPVLPRMLGPGTTDISATDRLIEFFQAHPMPRQR